jgi:hypothetical protein
VTPRPEPVKTTAAARAHSASLGARLIGNHRFPNRPTPLPRPNDPQCALRRRCEINYRPFRLAQPDVRATDDAKRRGSSAAQAPHVDSGVSAGMRHLADAIRQQQQQQPSSYRTDGVAATTSAVLSCFGSHLSGVTVANSTTPKRINGVGRRNGRKSTCDPATWKCNFGRAVSKFGAGICDRVEDAHLGNASNSRPTRTTIGYSTSRKICPRGGQHVAEMPCDTACDTRRRRPEQSPHRAI